MPAAPYLAERVVRESLGHAVGEVFQVMLGVPAHRRAWSEEEGASSEGRPPQVVGVVGFLGDASGLVYLHFDAALARRCTRRLLGAGGPAEDADDDRIVNDAVGELTSMVVGRFKQGLVDAGCHCTLTIPSILRGRNFIIEPVNDVVRYAYRFECEGHGVGAEVLIQAAG